MAPIEQDKIEYKSFSLNIKNKTFVRGHILIKLLKTSKFIIFLDCNYIKFFKF